MSFFSEKLRELRRRKKITQNELARDLNVAGGTIAMWETAKREPDIAMITKIAKYFDISVAEIISQPASVLIETQPKLTEAQTTLSKMILNLSDENCRRVQAFITGITIAEEEHKALIQKFKNRED